MLRYLTLAFIGFVNALPLPLSGTVLAVWLMESGFEKQLIGLFALCTLPFNAKILWTPLIDQWALPFSQGRERKSWLLFALMGISLALLGISFIQPEKSTFLLIFCLLLLSLFSGCLYMVGLAYERESLKKEQYASGSAYVITGYRVGLLLGGAGAFSIATLWDFAWTFRLASLSVALGSSLILFQKEPFQSNAIILEKRQQFSGFWQEIVQPFQRFFQSSDWRTILFLLLSFKLGDELIKNMTTLFYLSLGFNKLDLATISAAWGLAATIAGTTCAGLILRGKNHIICLVKTGFLHACSLSCFVILAFIGKSTVALYVAVGIENFTAGMALTAFLSFLWKISDSRYAAVQYAFFWSIFTFKGKLIGACGGFLAAYCGWIPFFLLSTCIAVASSLWAWRWALQERKKREIRI